MYYVYVIKSFRPTADHPQSEKKSWIYIGSTDDLRKRFQEHNLGRTKSTKTHRPFRLIYYEAYGNKTDARKREIELKRYGQKKEILFRQIENSLKF